MGSGSSVPLDELSRLSNDPDFGPKIRDIFEMLDTDNSGALDCSEIEAYLYRTVEYEEDLDDGEVAVRTKRETTLRFDELDLNGDGKITLEEFCNAIDAAVEMQRKQRLRKGELSNHRKLREEIDQAFRVLDKAEKEKSVALANGQVARYMELIVAGQQAAARKIAAAQKQAELDVFPAPTCVRRWASGLHGSLLRKTRAKDMQTAVNWLQTAVPFAGASGPVRVAIQALLANPDFTLNLSHGLLQELQNRAADAVLNAISLFGEPQDVMSIEQFVDKAVGHDISDIRAVIPRSQLLPLGCLEINCSALEVNDADSLSLSKSASSSEHHAARTNGTCTDEEHEDFKQQPMDFGTHNGERVPSDEPECLSNCTDNNHSLLLGQLLSLQVPQRAMETPFSVRGDANGPQQVRRLHKAGSKAGGLLARLINGEDNLNQYVQESEEHIMHDIEGMDEEDKAHLRAHIVRIVTEALRDDIQHELQSCAEGVAQLRHQTRLQKALATQEATKRASSATLQLLSGPGGQDMRSACSASEGPTEISSVVKEFPLLVPEFFNHDQIPCTYGENTTIDEENAGVFTIEQKQASHDTKSNQHAMATGVYGSARVVPADALTFTITLANASHFENFVHAVTKRFGGALSVQNGFRNLDALSNVYSSTAPTEVIATETRLSMPPKSGNLVQDHAVQAIDLRPGTMVNLPRTSEQVEADACATNLEHAEKKSPAQAAVDDVVVDSSALSVAKDALTWQDAQSAGTDTALHQREDHLDSSGDEFDALGSPTRSKTSSFPVKSTPNSANLFVTAKNTMERVRQRLDATLPELCLSFAFSSRQARPSVNEQSNGDDNQADESEVESDSEFEALDTMRAFATANMDAQDSHKKLNSSNDEQNSPPSSSIEMSLSNLLARPHMQAFLRRYYNCAGYVMSRGSLVHERWKRSVRNAIRYLDFAGAHAYKHVRLGFQCRFQLRAFKRLRKVTSGPLQLLGVDADRLGQCLHAANALPVASTCALTQRSLDDTTSIFGRLLQLFDSRHACHNGSSVDTSDFVGYDGSGDLQRDVQLFSLPIDMLSKKDNPEQAESNVLALDDANAEMMNVFVADEIEANVWSYRSPHGGCNALADACRHGCIQVVQAILQAEHRAHASKLLHDTDDEGLTPLAIAASFVEPHRCVTATVSNVNLSGLESCLPSEAKDTAASMVETLLAFDRMFNDGQIDLVLALPLAARAGASATTIKLLFEAKVELDERDRGCSALWSAARHGYTDIVDLLATARADVDLVDNRERTPLHIAAAYAHTRTVRCLLRHRAVIDWPDVTGCTALGRAAGRGHLSVVQDLIAARDFDPRLAARSTSISNGSRPRGDTLALLRAMDRGHLPIVIALLDHLRLPPIAEKWLKHQRHWRRQRQLRDLGVENRSRTDCRGQQYAGGAQVFEETGDGPRSQARAPATLMDFVMICACNERDDWRLLHIFLDRLAQSAKDDELALAGISLPQLLNGDICTGPICQDENSPFDQGRLCSTQLPPLLQAAQRGLCGILRELLQSKADVMVSAVEGCPGVHKAVQHEGKGESAPISSASHSSELSDLAKYAGPDEVLAGDTALSLAARSNAPGAEECAAMLRLVGNDETGANNPPIGRSETDSRGTTIEVSDPITGNSTCDRGCDLSSSTDDVPKKKLDTDGHAVTVAAGTT